jgi:16S rRNA (guanine527-N7)-methyltransferase
MTRTHTQKTTKPGLITLGPAHLRQEAEALGFTLTKAQGATLAQYLNLLMKWSRTMNLVGKTTWPEIFRDLAADSLYLAGFVAAQDLPERPLSLDLGAGAGLPGIPLRVLWPVGDYVLVELREKRAIFLRQAVSELGLPGVRVVHGRAEEVGPELARMGLAGATARKEGRAGDTRADLVVSRAFMPWPKLLPLAAQLIAPGGRLIILSNEKPPTNPAELPGFALVDSLDYPSTERTRYFWSLSPEAGAEPGAEPAPESASK